MTNTTIISVEHLLKAKEMLEANDSKSSEPLEGVPKGYQYADLLYFGAYQYLSCPGKPVMRRKSLIGGQGEWHLAPGETSMRRI
jgi:hypothetical protein